MYEAGLSAQFGLVFSDIIDLWYSHVHVLFLSRTHEGTELSCRKIVSVVLAL
jgi:hypothetical protein